MRSSDDLEYFRERERQCRQAAASATDLSARLAHTQLAEFYARRLEALESRERQAGNA